jgi:hypothetical protein
VVFALQKSQTSNSVREQEMAKKRDLNEDISLIERLMQDQLSLIESRLREIEQAEDINIALNKAKEALREMHELCTLSKALVSNLKNNDNGHSAKAPSR